MCNETTSLTPHKNLQWSLHCSLQLCACGFCLRNLKRCWVLHPGYCGRVVQKFRMDLSFELSSPLHMVVEQGMGTQIQHGLWRPTSSATNRSYSLEQVTASLSFSLPICKMDRIVVIHVKELWSGFIEISKWNNKPRAWQVLVNCLLSLSLSLSK